jgi:hypothetical protein
MGHAPKWGMRPSLVPFPLALTQPLPLAGTPPHQALSESQFLTLGAGRHAPPSRVFPHHPNTVLKLANSPLHATYRAMCFNMQPNFALLS